MDRKPLVWVGRSLNDLREFPEEARREAGHALDLVQLGLDPPDWKRMKTVGPGVFEIRIHAGGEFRIFYISKLEDAIYVLHAFQKKSRKTPNPEIDRGKRNLAAALRIHRERNR